MHLKVDTAAPGAERTDTAIVAYVAFDGGDGVEVDAYTGVGRVTVTVTGGGGDGLDINLPEPAAAQLFGRLGDALRSQTPPREDPI